MTRSETTAALKGRDLFLAIGDMMEKGGLDPTTANYDTCLRYLEGKDPELKARIDMAIARYGSFTPRAMATMPDILPPTTPRQFARLAEDSAKQIARMVDLSRQSGQDVNEYGAMLQKVDFEGDPMDMMSRLMSATRTMIAKGEAMERRYKAVSDEAEALRTDLAEARERAASDPLTGLANRRAFDAAMRDAVEDSIRNRTPMAVAIVDIDHFKRVNDTYGHDIGDSVIKYVGGLLQTTQGAPFVGRYGGEEFVLIFKGIDVSTAYRRLDDVRQKMQATPLTSTSTKTCIGKVTFSAGVAGPPIWTDATAMLKSADKALYRAKNQGRNRVEIAGSDE